MVKISVAPILLKPKMTVRASVFAVVESRPVALFVGLVVVGSIATMIVATVDAVYLANEDLFFGLEVATVSVFGIELLLRLWVCVEAAEYARPWGRLYWLVSFSAIVDVVATLPFVVLLAANGSFIHGFGAFSVLRVLRVVRLLKIDRFTKASSVLWGIVVRNLELLFVLLLLEVTLYIVVCSVLHLLGIYPSIPAAMYMGVLLVIGAGTPEEATLSVGGKVFVALCIYLSVIFFALPTGILAGSTGIEHTAERLLLEKSASREELVRLADDGGDKASSTHVCPNCSHAFRCTM